MALQDATPHVPATIENASLTIEADDGQDKKQQEVEENSSDPSNMATDATMTIVQTEPGDDASFRPLMKDSHTESCHSVVDDAHFCSVDSQEIKSKVDRSTHVSVQDGSALGVGISIGGLLRDAVTSVPLDKYSQAIPSSIKVNNQDKHGMEKNIADLSDVSKPESKVVMHVVELTELRDHVPPKVPEVTIKVV
ncbi:hypothetical protein APHAL10511_006986, partial [Amanita phalloides]